MERVVVVGPGAMGMLLAARFAEAAVPVRLLDYRRDRARKLNEDGITIIEGDGRSRVHTVPCATHGSGSSGLETATHVFLAVKTYDTEIALARVLEFLNPAAALVSLQNGLRHVELIREHLPAERTVFGTTAQGATWVETGKVRHCGEGETLLAAEGHNASRTAAAAALLNKAGIGAAVVDDLPFILWRKLLFNVAINPVTAVLGIRNGKIPRIPGAWDIATSCFREARETAALAVGPEIMQVGEEDLRELCEKTAENISSMLQDMKNGKRTEIGALNGVVVEEAQRRGKVAPANRMIVQFVTAMEEARR